MKLIHKIFIGLLALTFVACEKKVDAIDAFGVDVQYKSSSPKAVTGNITVNPKDSVFIDFTITSSKEDMAVIEIQKNSAKVDTFQVNGTDKRSFSGIKKYMIDSAAGDYSFRVMARNAEGAFIGDGEKLIIVTVKPDFVYHSYRFLYVPDSTAKTNKCYFSTATGSTFSYSDGAANSASIDFGYFYDTTTTGAPKHTLYALTASTFAPYDLTTWTKNATIMKKVTSPAFTTLTSGGAIRTGGITNLASGTANKITAIAAGNLVYFRTAAGKYGCLLVNFVEGTTASPSTYINVDVKVQL